jgi:hypothetical protein
MNSAQNALNRIIKPEWRDLGSFVPIDRDTALAIIKEASASFEFDDIEFEWDAMRGLLDYYSETTGGDGTLLLLAETGRKLSRERSGDKSGLSILGTALRPTVMDPNRSTPALVVLQQDGSKELGWSGHSFWWPILAAPGTVEPCVFATKVAA